MALTESEWAAELEASLGYPVLVRFGRSRTSPIQLRAAGRHELAGRPSLREGWVVRLHTVFAEAPPDVRADLASWIRVGRRARRACRDLGAWTERALIDVPPSQRRRQRVEPRGRVHDLQPLRDALVEEQFSGQFDLYRPVPPVTWGRRGKSRTRGRLQLGSFSTRTGIVRIHPVLDHDSVPAWVVRYVLFHELLHAALPEERDAAGRVLHHGPSFRERERAYPDYARALRWERSHLADLLRSARRGTAL